MVNHCHGFLHQHCIVWDIVYKWANIAQFGISSLLSYMADVPSINIYKRGFCPFSDRPIYMYGLPVPSSAASASAASWPTSTCYPNRPVTFCIATEHQKMLMGTVNHLQIIAMLLYYRRICEKNLLKSLTWFAKSEIQVNLFCNHQYFHFVTLSR